MAAENPTMTGLPEGKQPTLRVVPMPADSNSSGDIFGGWVIGASKGRVVTVAVNSFVFRQPVLVGDVVSLYAEIIKIGRTSITVGVEVYSQRNPAEPECVKVTEATLTYVAVDRQRQPRVVSAQ